MTDGAPVGGRYRLLERIGVGGMGRVWLADDDVLHRQVAIKEILLPEALTAEELSELRLRTLREARTAARLTHPNVVRVYDVIYANDRPWIVMEYVASRSLAQVVRDDRPLTPQETARVGMALVDALTAAHAAGVLHRDIKPGNVLLANDGRVMLTDFGLATFDEIGMQLTQSGIVHGSPQFISPERALDGTSSQAADMWSLGATLYAAVEGRSPYSRPTSYEILSALATSDPDPMVNAGPLTRVLTGLLRRDPAKRMKPEEMRARLERIANEPPSTRRRGDKASESFDHPSPLPPPLATVLPLDPISADDVHSLDPPSPRHRLGAASDEYRLPKAKRPKLQSNRSFRPAMLIASIVVGVLVLGALAAHTAFSTNGGSGAAGLPSFPPAVATPTATPSQTPSTPVPTVTVLIPGPGRGGQPPPPPPNGPQDVVWHCHPMLPPGTPTTPVKLAKPPKSAKAPASWIWFQHDGEYRLAMPSGYQEWQDPANALDCFFDPNRIETRVIGVNRWATSSDTPLASVTGLETQFRNGTNGSYQKLKLAVAKCVVTCVDWVYSYQTRSGVVVQVLTRTFFEPNSIAYMVSFSTSQGTWTSEQNDITALMKSFAPLDHV